MESHWTTVTLVCFLVSLIGRPALANDAPLHLTSGGAQALDFSPRMRVRMEAETVSIELHRDSYVVDATFQFRNEGDTLEMDVGFPKNGQGYLDNRFQHVGEFIRFETWVNGVSTPFLERPNESAIESDMTLPELVKAAKKQDSVSGALVGKDKRWMLKTVRFPGMSATTTRVRYEAAYSNASPCKGYAIYIYGTGKYWRGNIGTSRFVVDVTALSKKERPPSGHMIRFISQRDDEGAKHLVVSDGVEEAVLHDYKPLNDEDMVIIEYGCPEGY